MKKLIIFIFLSSLPALAGADCSKHPIFCQIKKNKPSINNQFAMKLSNLIYKMHKKYHIPSRIFTAILMQESAYTLKAKGKHCGYTEDFRKECVFSDYGITQIHYKTAELWDFDINLLTTDLEYSVEAGAKVLAYFMKRYEAKEVNWWVRYNCGTAKSNKRETCNIYKGLVQRYL